MSAASSWADLRATRTHAIAEVGQQSARAAAAEDGAGPAMSAPVDPLATATDGTAASERIDHAGSLGDRLVKLSGWANRVPQHGRSQVAVAIDALAVLLGELVALEPDDSTR